MKTESSRRNCTHIKRGLSEEQKRVIPALWRSQPGDNPIAWFVVSYLRIDYFVSYPRSDSDLRLPMQFLHIFLDSRKSSGSLVGSGIGSKPGGGRVRVKFGFRCVPPRFQNKFLRCNANALVMASLSFCNMYLRGVRAV